MKSIFEISGKAFECTGTLLRRIRVWDEAWVEDPIMDPEAYIRQFRGRGLRPDLFTFFHPLPDTERHYNYQVEWENVAAAPTTSYAAWWESLPQESRKNVRRAERRGLAVRPAEFDDALVQGISQIYNETPVRQGRRFWHYQKPFDQVKRENATYLERSQWVGAYLGEELVGFLKFVMVNKVGRIMQILSKEAHQDKRPTNALLAKAIELCAAKGASHFIYGEYVYGTKENSPMTEFKRRNGFVRMNYPRYYVPLSAKGRVALRIGLHRRLLEWIPEPAVAMALKLRARYYDRRLLRSAERAANLPPEPPKSDSLSTA